MTDPLRVTPDPLGDHLERTAERTERESQLTHAVRELSINYVRWSHLPQSSRDESCTNRNFGWLVAHIDQIDSVRGFEVFGFMWLRGWWQCNDIRLEVCASLEEKTVREMVAEVWRGLWAWRRTGRVDWRLETYLRDVDAHILHESSGDEMNVGAPPIRLMSIEDEMTLTATEAANLLGVSKAAITARCRRGTLPYVVDKRGRFWIRREDLGTSA